MGKKVDILRRKETNPPSPETADPVDHPAQRRLRRCPGKYVIC